MNYIKLQTLLLGMKLIHCDNHIAFFKVKRGSDFLLLLCKRDVPEEKNVFSILFKFCWHGA